MWLILKRQCEFNTGKSINLFIISTSGKSKTMRLSFKNAEKYCQMSASNPDKNSQQIKNRRKFLKSDTEHLRKPKFNIILNSDRLDISRLRSQTKQGRWLLTFRFDYVLKILANAVRQGKKGVIKMGKKE